MSEGKTLPRLFLVEILGHNTHLVKSFTKRGTAMARMARAVFSRYPHYVKVVVVVAELFLRKNYWTYFRCMPLECPLLN